MTRSQLINSLATWSRQKNNRWWYDLVTGEKVARCKDRLLMLMVGELSEAHEAIRKSKPDAVLMDKHLPHRPAEEVELADLFIRLMDYAGEHWPTFGEAVVEKMTYNDNRTDHTKEARLAPGGKTF